jgi:cysteine-rich repeat protein
VFVATDGDDDVNNGTRQAPFATIAKAVEIAKGSGLQFVYLAPGAYQENVVIEDLGAGLTFRGGWLLESGTTRWSADCDPQARLDTQISGRTDAPASTPTIELRGALGNTTFQTLAIRTKLTASVVGVGEGGDTMVGVFVNQTATGSLTLSDVWVASAAGGDGGAGQSPSAGGAVAPCQGVTDCSDGSTGPGGADGETPDRGTYTFDGFVPATGGAATPGAYGENGTPPGGLVTLDCRGCLSIVGCEEQDYTDESAQGTCGCAGSGGAEGTPGGGGGGSIAMYVASSTLQVDLDASLLEAGDGGAGAGAGDSSSPTAGASGAPESAFCETSCNLTTCISGTTNQTSVAGGDGGTGGPAGQSASGAAGPSHALVVVGDGNVALSGSELVNSGGDAPRFDFPSCGNGALDPGEECDDANRIDGDACSNSCTVNCDGAGTLNLVDGTCFQVPPTATSWDVARATCRNIGTGWDLLTFELTEALDATIDSGVLTGSAFWVGYRSFDGGTTFPGVDGSADPQIFWGGGEPSGDGACGELIVPSGALNDLSCVTPRRPICGRRVPNFQLPACLSADGGSCG